MHLIGAILCIFTYVVRSWHLSNVYLFLFSFVETIAIFSMKVFEARGIQILTWIVHILYWIRFVTEFFSLHTLHCSLFVHFLHLSQHFRFFFTIFSLNLPSKKIPVAGAWTMNAGAHTSFDFIVCHMHLTCKQRATIDDACTLLLCILFFVFLISWVLFVNQKRFYFITGPSMHFYQMNCILALVFLCVCQIIKNYIIHK